MLGSQGEWAQAVPERRVRRATALIEPVITTWKVAHPSINDRQGAYET
ncbi:hypothetical protein ACWDR1_34960 [Streptosporangium sandarakinum]